MVNSKELMIGAWVKSKKDLAKVTALYKENDGIHVEGNVFAENETSVDDEVSLIFNCRPAGEERLAEGWKRT